MADELKTPLTDDHYNQIVDALKRIKFGEEQIALAESAGLDMSQRKADLADAKQKLLGVKRAYFPNRA
jgi:uncharacterized lipoprotein YbaY